MTEAEFAVKLETHKNTVYRLAFSYLKNIQDAEDVTQEAFLKFFRSDVSFSAPENEKAWLIRVTVNLCKNRFRMNKIRRTIPLYDDATSDGHELMQSNVELLELLDKLKPKYRAVVHLFYYERYTTREIAVMLGKNENTIRTQLARGREYLREILTDDFGNAVGGVVYES